MSNPNTPRTILETMELLAQKLERLGNYEKQRKSLQKIIKDLQEERGSLVEENKELKDKLGVERASRFVLEKQIQPLRDSVNKLTAEKSKYLRELKRKAQ